jgi:hypothetical protein
VPIVAGPGIEPGPQGYEPCEIPLLYPAIYKNAFYERYAIVLEKGDFARRVVILIWPLLTKSIFNVILMKILKLFNN